MPTDFCISRYFPGLKLPDAKNFEANRLVTYKNWNNEHIFASTLAEAGFSHTGQGDEVECCFCKLRYSDWQPGLKPIEIHRQHSPNCYLFTEDLVQAKVGPNIRVPSTKRSRMDNASLVKTYLNKQGASCCGVPDTGVQENKDDNVNAPVQFAGVRMRRERRFARAGSNSNFVVPQTADGNPPYTASESVEEEESVGTYPQFSMEGKREHTYRHFPLDREALVDQLRGQGFFYTDYNPQL
ncbi:death-associated inhibitor of apoptosis 1-like isoform X2 [Littorina saxatilis]|uniref:death-associated inhibitor of apoptosis 1-like isoform X2 n=1 Tax=Littorina saxatilis TaxID=31220 RepID=UPI0038B658D2